MTQFIYLFAKCEVDNIQSKFHTATGTTDRCKLPHLSALGDFDMDFGINMTLACFRLHASKTFKTKKKHIRH